MECSVINSSVNGINQLNSGVNPSKSFVTGSGSKSDTFYSAQVSSGQSAASVFVTSPFEKTDCKPGDVKHKDNWAGYQPSTGSLKAEKRHSLHATDKAFRQYLRLENSSLEAFIHPSLTTRRPHKSSGRHVAGAISPTNEEEFKTDCLSSPVGYSESEDLSSSFPEQCSRRTGETEPKDMSDAAFFRGGVTEKKDDKNRQNDAPKELYGLKLTDYVYDPMFTNELPQATGTENTINYGIGDEYLESTEESRKKGIRSVPDERKVDELIQQSPKKPAETVPVDLTAQGQQKAAAGATPILNETSFIQFSPSSTWLPMRACLVFNNEQYRLEANLLSQPEATKYLVKTRVEIEPGRYLTRLFLKCSSKENRLLNVDAHKAQDEKSADNNGEQAPVKERKHFPFNIPSRITSHKEGYIIFTSDPTSFSGSIQYPLPTRKAVANRIGYGGNAVVFVVFHAGKEFAVKKTVYRKKEINFHSQLAHPNIINLEAVMVGERHQRRRDKHYVYCFMPKMDINLRNLLSRKEHGCLKHIKAQLRERIPLWDQVLRNTKHILKSVLKALDYMHNQALVQRDVKASNILIKRNCRCEDLLYCDCNGNKKFSVRIGDFDSTAEIPGHNLDSKENQMFSSASVLPLGTMGYRAPEVSMHLVLSGPYEVLYNTSVDIWSFGCLLLSVFIGKSGPLKQRDEACLLLSVRDENHSEELYNQIINIKEMKKYFNHTAGVCDLVNKCLQVRPHCRPSAKELLELDFFKN